MDNYSLCADLLTTFRSSSDLVRVVWILGAALMPTAFLLSLGYVVPRVRRPPKPKSPNPSFVFETPDFGRVEVYRDAPLYETLNDLNSLKLLLTETRANDE